MLARSRLSTALSREQTIALAGFLFPVVILGACALLAGLLVHGPTVPSAVVAGLLLVLLAYGTYRSRYVPALNASGFRGIW
jgi:hypothetical protein